MKMSLINVSEQNGNRVSGYWLQNHIGTMETAREAARRTEEANGGKITVAIVPEVASGSSLNGPYDDLLLMEDHQRVTYFSMHESPQHFIIPNSRVKEFRAEGRDQQYKVVITNVEDDEPTTW